MQSRTPVQALGEVALRVSDLARMRRFYVEVLGLDVLGESAEGVLFRIAPGYGGHTQVLALFDRGVPLSAAQTTLDHLAFTIDRANFEAERRRLEALGLELELRTHAWVHWRSLYFRDPEGNEVELVCYDPAV
jgi:catechol 2,3-dioxygenase-like lactoylglutathione lyase family enzyme